LSQSIQRDQHKQQNFQLGIILEEAVMPIIEPIISMDRLPPGCQETALMTRTSFQNFYPTIFFWHTTQL
jgi:hypothetical protein